MTRPSACRFRRDAALSAALVLVSAAPLGCELIDSSRAKGGTGDSVLEIFAPPTPQEAVAWASDPYDADKRYRGLLLIANAPFGGDSLYVRMYEQASTDGDPGVRAMAVRALGRHGGPEHAEILLRTFNDDDDVVRWETARALQRIYAPQVVSALVDHVNEERESSALVREASAIALGQYADPQVMQPLFAALNDRKLAVNVGAQRSLEILTGESFPADAAAWLRWYNGTGEPFANRGEYEYPVFQRDAEWWEYITPWSQVPNEVAGRPAGAP